MMPLRCNVACQNDVPASMWSQYDRSSGSPKKIPTLRPPWSGSVQNDIWYSIAYEMGSSMGHSHPARMSNTPLGGSMPALERGMTSPYPDRDRSGIGSEEEDHWSASAPDSGGSSGTGPVEDPSGPHPISFPPPDHAAPTPPRPRRAARGPGP